MTNPTLESLVQDISQRLSGIQDEMADAARRSGRSADVVRLVAVTKTHPSLVLQAAVLAGVTEIGENYIQEAEEKFTALGWPEATASSPPVIRHAIGHLQTNKIRKALRWFEMIHTVDSLRLAESINQIAGEMKRTVRILLQVNISEEPTKFGIFPEDIAGVLPGMANLPHIQVDGLMMIGRMEPDPESAREEFRALRNLRDRLQRVAPSGIHLHELSMGMSHDFAIAIEEGATLVRVGSRLFGSRTPVR